MAGNRVGEKAVFQNLPAADVVYNQVPLAIGRFFRGYDTNVREFVSDHPSDKIAGFVMCGILRHGVTRAKSFKKYLKVWYAAMIDVGVRLFQTPAVWIFGEIATHVFVNFLLKVNAEFSVGADDDIGTDAFALRDIAVGIVDPKIGRIVNHFVSCQRQCGIRQPLFERIFKCPNEKQ